MRQILILIGMIVAGAAVLSPVIAALGLDPLPGDIAINQGWLKFTVPVAYSLCASLGLTLLYYVARR